MQMKNVVLTADLGHDMEQAFISAQTVTLLLEALHYDLVAAGASVDQFEGLLHKFASAPTAATATDFDSALMSSFSRLAGARSATAQTADVLSDFNVQWRDCNAARECLTRHAPKHPVVQALPSVTWQLYLYAVRKGIQLTSAALSAVWDSQAQPGAAHVLDLCSVLLLTALLSCSCTISYSPRNLTSMMLSGTLCLLACFELLVEHQQVCHWCLNFV